MQIPLPAILIVSFLVGSLSAYYAYRTDKNPYLWFGVGFFFGILGLFIIFFMPKRKPKQAVEPIVTFNLRGPTDKLWYYLNQGNSQEGPMSHNALMEAWKLGKIGPATYLWHEELPEWKSLSDLSE